jgi:hypothetical protein
MPYDLTVPGWMKESDLQAIERIAQGLPEAGVAVEIGSFLGRSAVAWAQSAPTATLHCIDVWSEPGWFEDPGGAPAPAGDLSRYTGSYEGTFRAVTGPYPNVIVHQGRSTDPWDIADVDLVFVDGDHSFAAVRADLEYWSSRLQAGGLLCGHDFSSHPSLIGVTQAVMDFALQRNLSLFSPGGTTIWLLLGDPVHQRRWWFR